MNSYYIRGEEEKLKLRLPSMGTQWALLQTCFKHYYTFVMRTRTEYYGLMQFVLTRAIKKNEDIKLTRWGRYINMLKYHHLSRAGYQ